MSNIICRFLALDRLFYWRSHRFSFKWQWILWLYLTFDFTLHRQFFRWISNQIFCDQLPFWRFIYKFGSRFLTNHRKSRTIWRIRMIFRCNNDLIIDTKHRNICRNLLSFEIVRNDALRKFVIIEIPINSLCVRIYLQGDQPS